MRLVDTDKLPHQTVCTPCREKVSYVCLSDIMNAPTISAVPVVRCRECKYWRRYTRQWENHCAGECERHRMEGGTYENDFCSYGQRKKDEHDKHPSDPL